MIANPQTYFDHFTLRKIQVSKGYYVMYHCKFAENNPDYPPEAWLKVFSKDKYSEFHREQSMLIGLKDSNPNLSIPSYLHHHIAKQLPCLFFSVFDTILDSEIIAREKERRYWSEQELWLHLTQLSELVFTLHSQRIVHRNICPATVFLKDGKACLGNFEDSKQIPRGVTEQFQTLRGCVVYLSPQAYTGIHTQSFTTYEEALKDDMWGLGLILLSMATLDNSKSLSSFFNSPQTKFSEYIASLLGSRYSSNFVQVVIWLLSLDSNLRPGADDLLGVLRETFAALRCFTCHNWVYRFDKAKLPCNHSYCENCLTSLIQSSSCRPLICQCQLSTDIPFIYLNILSDIQQSKVLTCIACSRVYGKAIAADNREGRFTCECSCGTTFCSLCKKLGGHTDELESCATNVQG